MDVERTCEVCGKTWTTPEWDKSNKRFCSRACYGVSKRGVSITPLAEVLVKSCPVCAKEFETGGVGRPPRRQKCCSVECSRASLWVARKTDEGRTEKMCAGCGEVKSLDAFPKKTGASDGLQIRCRPCHAQFIRDWRRNKAKRQRAAEKRCPRCGEVKPGTDFSRTAIAADGCFTYCRPCAAEYRKERVPFTAGARAVTEKRCPMCGETKPDSEYFRDNRSADGLRGYCKPCWTAYQRATEPREKRPERQRDSHLRRAFGITGAQYEAMFEAQGGTCAVCRTPPGKRRLAVDHDHKTGAVRALL